MTDFQPALCSRGQLSKYKLVVLALIVLTGCKKRELEGYRVMSHDAVTGTYVILRTGTFSNGEGKAPSFLRKRLTVVCQSFQWGSHEMVRGQDACNLQVGHLYAQNLKSGPDKLITDELSGDTLYIAEGDGADETRQILSIVKYEVLQDDTGN